MIGGRFISVEITDDFIEVVAARAAELVRERSEVEPYIDSAEAAEFFRCPRSRIYALVSAGRIPVHRDGSRLLFLRSELRTFVEEGGACRP